MCEAIGAHECDSGMGVDCGTQYAAACESMPACHSYGTSSVWRNGTVAQLFATASEATAVPNPQWNLYVSDPLKHHVQSSCYICLYSHLSHRLLLGQTVHPLCPPTNSLAHSCVHFLYSQTTRAFICSLTRSFFY